MAYYGLDSSYGDVDTHFQRVDIFLKFIRD